MLFPMAGMQCKLMIIQEQVLVGLYPRDLHFCPCFWNRHCTFLLVCRLTIKSLKMRTPLTARLKVCRLCVHVHACSHIHTHTHTLMHYPFLGDRYIILWPLQVKRQDRKNPKQLTLSFVRAPLRVLRSADEGFMLLDWCVHVPTHIHRTT